MHTCVTYAPSLKHWEIYLRIFDTVLVPEINNGQLVKIIRDVLFLWMQNPTIK